MELVIGCGSLTFTLLRLTMGVIYDDSATLEAVVKLIKRHDSNWAPVSTTANLLYMYYVDPTEYQRAPKFVKDFRQNI